MVWTQTQLNYSIISATIPTLRIFATTLNTQFGGLTAVERADYNSDSHEKHSSADRDQDRDRDRERSGGSQDQSTLPVDTSDARKESATSSFSRFSSRQNHHTGYNVSSLNQIGEPDERRKFSWQRNKARQLEKDEEITPVDESRRIAGKHDVEMTTRKEVAYGVEHE